MARDPSRWWYALVPFPALVGVRYGLEWLTTQLLPSAGPTAAEALPVLLAGLGTSLVGTLVIVTAPLFVAGLLLDMYRLRTDGSWTPHWVYAALAVPAVGGLVVQWVAPFSIPTAIGYLARRRHTVGAPLGTAAADGPATPATRASSSSPSHSRWWYGVVIPPVLATTGGSSCGVSGVVGYSGKEVRHSPEAVKADAPSSTSAGLPASAPEVHASREGRSRQHPRSRLTVVNRLPNADKHPLHM